MDWPSIKGFQWRLGQEGALALPVVTIPEPFWAAVHPSRPTATPDRGGPQTREDPREGNWGSQTLRSSARLSPLMGDLEWPKPRRRPCPQRSLCHSLSSDILRREILLIDLIPSQFIYSSLSLSLSFWASIWGRWCLYAILNQWRDLYRTFLNAAFSRAENRASYPFLLPFLIFPLASPACFQGIINLEFCLTRCGHFLHHGHTLSRETPVQEPLSHSERSGGMGWDWGRGVTAYPCPPPRPKLLSADEWPPGLLFFHLKLWKVPSS